MKGWRRMIRLAGIDRRAKVTLITCDEQKNNWERTFQNLRLQLAQAEQNWIYPLQYESMKTNLPCVNSLSWCWQCNSIGNLSLAHFVSLKTNQSWCECHRPALYCCWPCASVYDLNLPSSNGNSQCDDASCHKAKSHLKPPTTSLYFNA